jgi:hypothetical protein
MAWRRPDPARGQRLEEALAARLYGASADGDPLFASLDPDEVAEAARTVRQLVLGRSHRGTGGIREWYPRTLSAWVAAHPDDVDFDDLAGRFCVSAACLKWRELPSGEPGISLEEALYRFFVDAAIGDPALRQEEFLSTLVRALAVTPHSQFVWPAEIRRAPGGCFAVTRSHVLHAAIDGRYVCGGVTPLIAAVLNGDDVGPEAVPVIASLRSMRLID